jgi:hypothetical protein
MECKRCPDEIGTKGAGGNAGTSRVWKGGYDYHDLLHLLARCFLFSASRVHNYWKSDSGFTFCTPLSHSCGSIKNYNLFKEICIMHDISLFNKGNKTA